MSDDGEVPSRYKMPTAEQKAHAKRLVALYDYEPTLDDTDIALQQGKVVYGVELQGDWWWGYNSKRSGIFPANYVEEERFDDTDTDNDPEVPVHNQDEEQPQESQSDGASEINLPPAELEQQDEDSSDDDESAPPSAPARSSPRASPDAAAATSRRQRVSSGGRSQDSKLIPGLNLRWVAADNLHLRHTLLLWNGSFSAFVRAELLLTDNFLIEAIYFTEDLPELTVYPLYKLYIDADQKIDQGFLKRAYFSFRSQYYFCNLSTTANGGGHNELVTTFRERHYTYVKSSKMNARTGTKFLMELKETLVQWKQLFDKKFIAHTRSLPGYELLYQEHPPHFDQKILDLVFATDICKLKADCFVHFDCIGNASTNS